MAGFAQELFAGVTLEIETALSPPVSVDLAGEVGEGPGLASKLLRPRYTLRRGNVVLLAHQPAGDPREIRTIALFAAAGLLLLLLFRR